jgi:ParB family chromosome partitioning protein
MAGKARAQRTEGVAVRQVRVLELEDLHPSPDNARQAIGRSGMDELAASIAAVGLLVPLLVRPSDDGFEVVAGCRRLEAVRRLGWESVECVVEGEAVAPAGLVSFHENAAREGLSDIETCGVVWRLMDSEGGKAAVAARLLGRSEAWVTQRMGAREWPEVLLAYLEAGSLSFTQCRGFSRLGADPELESLCRFAAEGGASVRTIEGWVGERLARRSSEGRAKEVVGGGDGEVERMGQVVECSLCERRVGVEDARVIHLCAGCYEAAGEAGRG